MMACTPNPDRWRRIRLSVQRQDALFWTRRVSGWTIIVCRLLEDFGPVYTLHVETLQEKRPIERCEMRAALRRAQVLTLDTIASAHRLNVKHLRKPDKRD